MALESFSFIDSLNASNPDGGDDLSDGDAHVRGIKTVLLGSFPNVGAEVSASAGELNMLVGVTSALQTQLDLKAPLASPSFTGTASAVTLVVTTAATLPAATSGITAASSANNTLLATTEYVQTAVAGATGGVSRGKAYFYSNL